MAMPSYDPWSLLSHLSRDLSPRFQQPRPRRRAAAASQVADGDWVPAVDIKEEQERFVIYADVPGVDPQDIDVRMEKGILSLSGRRSAVGEPERQGFKRVERRHGSFLRRFTLPDGTDGEHVSARCRNGVLEVVIPKHQKLRPRKIAVGE